MNNRFLITLLILTTIIVGIFIFSKKDNKDSTTTKNIQPTNHIKGQGKSGVTLVEYGDFQCPACYQYEPMVRQIVDKYIDQITFQFRNFPLSSIHPNAFAASRAAEAADKQGKFWEMHDKLYETQDPSGKSSWNASSNPSTFFHQFAKDLGLDVEKFKADYASEQINSLINADLTEGKKIPVEGTPTFQLNGVKIENPRSFEDFAKLIDEAIKTKNSQQ